MKRKTHFRFHGKPLCGIRAGGRQRSRLLTTNSNERAVTCKNCRRLIKQNFVYYGFALFDGSGSLLWPSGRGTREGVREWALKDFEGQTWKQILRRGYRIQPVLLQRV